MTTRTIALYVNDDIMPAVHARLADHDIHLGATMPVVDGVHCYQATGPFPSPQPAGLSDRELAMLFALADGKPLTEIAALLDVSRRAAHRRAKALFVKLGAGNKCEAVAIAYRMGALDTWQEAAA